MAGSVLALADADHSEVGRPSARLHRLLCARRPGRRSSCATCKGLPVDRPRALGIARMQATDLHPPLAVFLYRNRQWPIGQGSHPMTELLRVAAREVRIPVGLVQASSRRGTIRPFGEIAVVVPIGV